MGSRDPQRAPTQHSIDRDDVPPQSGNLGASLGLGAGRRAARWQQVTRVTGVQAVCICIGCSGGRDDTVTATEEEEIHYHRVKGNRVSLLPFLAISLDTKFFLTACDHGRLLGGANKAVFICSFG